MTQISKNSTTFAQQIPDRLRLSAAQRLVPSPGRREAAKRLIASAPANGIDLSLMWGVIDPPIAPSNAPPNHARSPKQAHHRVRQVALAVLGSGRTAMIFLSNPDNPHSFGPVDLQTREIALSIQAALDGLVALAPDQVALAQTLIEPDQQWAHRACLDAGMVSVGQLDYMRKPITPAQLIPQESPDWPDGIEVHAMRSLEEDRHLLIEALDGSYQQTLDCPELCGLRTMDDVVDSHSTTGVFAPSRWHLVFKDGQPAGCCLLTHCPSSRSVELVYLGIAPCARGLGLGRLVLEYAIQELGKDKTLDILEVTCAVDNRNGPAISIYESMGFACFDARVGFVAPITPKTDS